MVVAKTAGWIGYVGLDEGHGWEQGMKIYAGVRESGDARYH